ncbi:S-adenosyl-L-methionine-dependent methyltransferase [Pestalotiopsis sp. NC0098]|nr:S-adenosyl-L-methionine-dependent methyltransferase [Pestalotiopsis sp. NC0098]
MASKQVSPGAVTQLLTQIQDNTQILLEYFASNNLPEPSYEDGDGLPLGQELPQKVQAAKDIALEATDELHHLLLGPLMLLVTSPGDQYQTLALQYIYRYKLAQHVPVDGSETTFEDIAKAAGVGVKDVTRFLRVAMGRHVFAEPRKGAVKHTAASRILLQNPLLEAWLMNIAEEFSPSLTRTVDATVQWPGSEEPNESGYSLSHNTNENPFDVIKKDPQRQQRFIDAMSYSHIHDSYSIDHLLRAYDFSSAKTIVDVGGSHGQVAMALVKKYDQIESVIVEDLPDTISGLEAHVAVELRDKVQGRVHDFLTPQPVKGADVYLLRWILHDWSDKYSVIILRNLIPALKRGAKVVINDICIPEPGQVPISVDRSLRKMDISMKAFNNARERDGETWAGLFAEADSRFKFLGITMPEGARMAIIEAEWVGDDQ